MLKDFRLYDVNSKKSSYLVLISGIYGVEEFRRLLKRRYFTASMIIRKFSGSFKWAKNRKGMYMVR